MNLLISTKEFVNKDLFVQLGKEEVTVCRVGEVFGEGMEGGKVAELCRKVVNGELERKDPNEVVNLMYVGDVVEELRKVECEEGSYERERCVVPRFYTKVWGEVVNLVCSFKDREDAGEEIELRDDFERKLYATFLSYCDGRKDVK